MSIKHRLRTLALCLPLLLGSFTGIAMLPDEVEELMHSMNQQKITAVSEEQESDGGIPNVLDGDA